MQHCDSLFHAARILTQDAGRSLLDDAALAVRDGLVVAAGPVARVEKEWTPDKRIDLPNMLLMPGLVNAHTHAAMTFLRGLADDMPLMDCRNIALCRSVTAFMQNLYVTLDHGCQRVIA